MKINKHEFKRKQPAGNNDYEIAYNAILNARAGENTMLHSSNLKTLRKYLYDLAAKKGIDITTRKLAADSLVLYCLRTNTRKE